MTTLDPRPGAEAAPVAVAFTDPYRVPVSALVDAPGQFEDFRRWSSLSWEERADYITRHCLSLSSACG